jgi:NTE family protein
MPARRFNCGCSKKRYRDERAALAAAPPITRRTASSSPSIAVVLITAVDAPYRIGEDRYINGGYRRSENADLAAGYGRVLVLSPFGGRSRMPLEWDMDLATQVDELRAGGSWVETVFPDARAGDVFNANALDPSTRLQAARGGYDQGRALAELLGKFWH